MSGNEAPAVLDPGPPLGRRFEKIPRLPHDGERGAGNGEMKGIPQAERIAHRGTGDGSPGHAADQARPGLAGTDARRELGSSGSTSDEIRANVGGPDTGEDPQDRLASRPRLMAQPEQRNQRREPVDPGQNAQDGGAAGEARPFEDHDRGCDRRHEVDPRVAIPDRSEQQRPEHHGRERPHQKAGEATAACRGATFRCRHNAAHADGTPRWPVPGVPCRSPATACRRKPAPSRHTARAGNC